MKVFIKTVCIIFIISLLYSCSKNNVPLADKIKASCENANRTHYGALSDFPECAEEAEYNLDIIDREVKTAFTINHNTGLPVDIAEAAKSADRELPDLDLAIDSVIMNVYDGEIRDITNELVQGEISSSAFKEKPETMISNSKYSNLDEAIKKNRK